MEQAENDVLDTATAGEELNQEQQVDEQGQPGDEGQQPPGGDESQDDEVAVTIGGESPTPEEDDSRAPEWVRDLRKSNREKDRRLRELAEENAKLKGGNKPTEIGEKPTLDSCDFDTDEYERQLEAWHERKRKAEAESRAREEEQEAGRKAFQASLDTYGKLKGELKVKDFDDAEAAVIDAASENQRAIIVHVAKNSALVTYALGKNPKKLKELASIKDPVKFAYSLAELESQLKVTPKKSPPPPESTVRGSAPGMGAMDAQLKRLEDEAERTGDRTKVIAYKKQLKQKAAT